MNKIYPLCKKISGMQCFAGELIHSRKGQKKIVEESSQRKRNTTVTVSHISKSYGSQTVLQDYTMTMEAGKRYLLMAPSGAGKTTLLRILTGLDHADLGQVTEIPRPIGMVFQEDRLCEEYDAVCNIMLGMGQAIAGGRWGGTERLLQFIRQEAALILPADCLTKPVKELSGGMRRRVALLRAVLSSSDVLVLDEPFSGLDEENRACCGEYLLARLKGRTLLATTHREEDVWLLQGEVKFL